MSEKKRAELVETVSKLISLLSDEEKKDVIGEIMRKKGSLPISIFRGNLSGLEAIVVYLKDHENKTIKEIASLLNRESSTIYATYYKAAKKNFVLDISDFSVSIPLDIFSERKFSILESLIAHLKQDHKLVEIARLLNKKYSTIATTYNRYKQKC